LGRETDRREAKDDALVTGIAAEAFGTSGYLLSQADKKWILHAAG